MANDHILFSNHFFKPLLFIFHFSYSAFIFPLIFPPCLFYFSHLFSVFFKNIDHPRKVFHTNPLLKILQIDLSLLVAFLFDKKFLLDGQFKKFFVKNVENETDLKESNETTDLREPQPYCLRLKLVLGEKLGDVESVLQLEII